MSMRKPKGGNPKGRTSGRVTPKGGHVKASHTQGIAAEAPGATDRALAAAGHGPRRSVAVHPHEWTSEAQRTAVLKGVLAVLEEREA